MDAAKIVRAAIPDATLENIDYILWSRTPYPVGRVSARSLYKAARRLLRANNNDISLCETCNNRCDPKAICCDKCLYGMAV